MRIPLENNKLKVAPKESSLICIEGGSAGRKVAFLSESVCFVNKLACFKVVDSIFSKFLFYSLKGNIFQTQFQSEMSGLIGGVAISSINNFRLLFPSRSEQTAIAEFLDRKTALIDKAIAIKEKQIELLKERRQILIHKAVTKGLNYDENDDMKTMSPNHSPSKNQKKSKFRHSGVEWIGEIPEHWEVKPLKFIGETQNGVSKGAEYFGTGFPFVGYGDVYQDFQLPNQVKGLAQSSPEDRKQYSVIKGDIFFTRTSETVEEIGFSSTCLQTIENATFAGFLIRFRPYRNILDKHFSKYYFRSKTHRPFFVKEMNLVIRASLSQELLKKMPVLLPPLKEQEQIGRYLDELNSKFVAVLSLKQKEIEKLQEYKSTLINSAVTGKIKIV